MNSIFVIFVVVFVTVFASVVSAMVDERALGIWHHLGYTQLTDCISPCPTLFPYASSQEYEGKKQCVCKRSVTDTNMYTLDEANCIQLVSSGEENPQCATALCPIGFQKGVSILEKNRQWQWHCSAKEFDNDRISGYTISDAKGIYGICNGEHAAGGKGCRKLCPDKYNHGDCIADKEASISRCGCSQDYKSGELYGIFEAKAIVTVCSVAVQHHKGCEKLCPHGFTFGRCFKIARNYYCGCRQEETGLGWYTIPKVREMLKVCSSTIQDNKGCQRLCPEKYKKNGRCFRENGQEECECNSQVQNGRWVTLKEAILAEDRVYAAQQPQLSGHSIG